MSAERTPDYDQAAHEVVDKLLLYRKIDAELDDALFGKQRDEALGRALSYRLGFAQTALDRVVGQYEEMQRRREERV